MPLESWNINFDQITINVNKNHLIISLHHLRLHSNSLFNILSCISGVDLLNKGDRFQIIFDILSFKLNNRIRVKTNVNEIEGLPSTVCVFINSNWWEREIFDMFGVFFSGHPDLRRILTDYGFQGYPLRKDFPLSGLFDLRYDKTKKRIVQEKIQLTQKDISHNNHSSWTN
uniref:NADH dehydrogenase subunit 9 n=1 Tax=Ishige okamurae TaxID=233772 RepID=UPI002E7A9986|nr:NADH dehydrogenase subunit 9 [Ishige okamurae]WBP70209.1 NADH dehydrogenase subunit 9 [Ishige okamurae]